MHKQAPKDKSWMEWYSSTPLVSWVSGVRLAFLREFEHDVKLGLKTETRRYDWKPRHRTQFDNAFGAKKWVRAMLNRANSTHFGWLFITDLYTEMQKNMPADAPVKEGRPNMSLIQFKRKCFQCTCNEALVDACKMCTRELVVIKYKFQPLGDETNPYPPRIPAPRGA